MAELITRAVVTMGWYCIPVLKDAMVERVHGFFAALFATWLVSLFTDPSDDSEKVFREMLEEDTLN